MTVQLPFSATGQNGGLVVGSTAGS